MGWLHRPQSNWREVQHWLWGLQSKSINSLWFSIGNKDAAESNTVTRIDLFLASGLLVGHYPIAG